MTSPELFFDSSALFAGIVSASGASRALLLLAEAGQIAITVSEQVLTETERAVARKIPRALPDFREALRATDLRIVRDPTPDEIEAYADIIAHRADVPIVVAAMRVKTDYLVTLNRRHFIDDPMVAERSKLRIGTPGDALAWVRQHLAAAGN
ncbi:MAG: PIN domain-containing protein [Anaerolineae bacterium]|nr:PIN domain-containing protein [Anaerolineae bacterium]